MRACHCQPKRDRIQCQTSLAKTQLSRRCEMDSFRSCEHSTQMASSCRPCHFLLTAVQQQSSKTGHTKNLHLPGARDFFFQDPGAWYFHVKVTEPLFLTSMWKLYGCSGTTWQLILHWYYEQLKKGCPDYRSYKKWRATALREIKRDKIQMEWW